MPYGKKLSLFTILMTIFFLSLTGEKGNVLADKEKYYDYGDPLKILIDTDMGLDDVRALFALLADPCIDICGIVTVEGSASSARGWTTSSVCLRQPTELRFPLIWGMPHLTFDHLRGETRQTSWGDFPSLRLTSFPLPQIPSEK